MEMIVSYLIDKLTYLYINNARQFCVQLQKKLMEQPNIKKFYEQDNQNSLHIFVSIILSAIITSACTVNSLLEFYANKINEAVTICCSDALTRTTDMNVEQRLQYLRNLTDLFHRTFKGQFVFPALGHEDIGVNYTQLATLWQNWLPPEAVDTFVKGTLLISIYFSSQEIFYKNITSNVVKYFN